MSMSYQCREISMEAGKTKGLMDIRLPPAEYIRIIHHYSASTKFLDEE